MNNPIMWFAISGAAMSLSIHLFLWAWKNRHRDSWWWGQPVGADDKSLSQHNSELSALRAQGLVSTYGLCATCVEGVAEMSRTTVTGSWTCPRCGTPHTFVDGQPGVINV